MKAKEVHKLSDEELDLEAKRLRKRLFELRQQAVTEKIADTSQFHKIRRDVARLLTESATRKRKASAAAAPAAAKVKS
jgi:ribosomal protein L29